MIKIDSFVKKNSSNPSSSNGGGFANGTTTTTIQKELETHKLWGQPFNGTEDVDGDMAVNGNVSINGKVTAENGGITSIESESITNVGTITTDTVDATTLEGANANIVNQLNVKDIISKDITTDYLTVTKSAHFWELIINKISSTKGAIIVSPANCTVEKVEEKNGQYTLYWRSEDSETGKAITNDFQVNDQIICQTFNAADIDNYNVSNKFYWKLVTKVGRTGKEDSLRGGVSYWNFITLSATDGEGDSIPEVGDNIVVLGNRTNEDRQNAIIISSTNSDYLDTVIQAPSIVQYKGIKSYDLKAYRYNVLAANGNTFIGNFKVVANDGTLSDIESGKDGKDGKIYILESTPSTIILNSDGSFNRDNQYDNYHYMYVQGYEIVDGKRNNIFTVNGNPVTCRLSFNDGDVYTEYTAEDYVGIDFDPKFADSYYSLLQEIANNGLKNARAIMYEGVEYNKDKVLATLDIPIIKLAKDGVSYTLTLTRGSNGVTQGLYVGVTKYVGSDCTTGTIKSLGMKCKAYVNGALAEGLTNRLNTSDNYIDFSAFPNAKSFSIVLYEGENAVATANYDIGQNGKDGQSTQYINVIAECSSEDFNSDKGTGHSYTSYVYLDGKLLSTAVYRGHTMIVVDPTTKTVNSTTNYDTYNEDDNTASTAMSNLITAIDNVANDKIIIIVSHDATSCNQTLRNKLSNEYHSNISSNATLWNRERYSHAVIIFKHSNREHQCFEQFNQFKPSYLTAYYTSDNMSLAGKDGNNSVMDKMSMTKTLANVNINDIMYVYIEGYVNHIDGDRTTRITDLSDYKLKLIDSKGRVSTAITSKTNTFAYSALWQSSYSQQTNRITHFRLQLLDTSNNILDEMTFNVTFDAGAVLTVGKNAITSSVQQSKTYTDGQISTVKQTADGIASRVTKIEGDYVTESKMTQTANNISLSVYDNLKNKTGIDVTTGKIVLNADNVQVKGNFNLTDTENGMTIYDKANTPLINLQPTEIAKIATFTNDKYFTRNFTLPATKGGSAISISTNKTDSFTLKKGEVLRMSNITLTFYANDGTTIYPTVQTLTGGVRIYNSNNEIVNDEKKTCTRQNAFGSYSLANDTVYRATADGTYTVALYITTPVTWANTYTVQGYGSCRMEIGNNIQSFIGSDGAFFHNAPNKMIYSSEDELRLQFGYNGIRWNNDNKNFNEAMEVLCAIVKNNDYTYSPLYLPFYNYIPSTSTFTYTYQYLTNIGGSRYAHVINPRSDVGILLVNMAAMNDNGQYQETWFVLPNSSIKMGSTYFALPVGYMVKIINAQTNANVYVTVDTTSKGNGVIYTSESSKTTSMKLTVDNSMKTFMYIGGFGTESESAWRVID